MIKKELLKNIISDNQKNRKGILVRTDISVPLNSGKVVSIFGVRRSGKTSILYKTAENIAATVGNWNDILFINFEDERLSLQQEELDLVIQAYRELNPGKDLSASYFFFDEIQVVKGWEKFVRRLHENVSKNIFITGSNAKLMSREIATALRGRTFSIEVFPLCFRDYLHFRQAKDTFRTADDRAEILVHLSNYLKNGGFPELVTSEEEIRIRSLQEYFNVMLYRDMMERYEITQAALLKFFLKRLTACAAKSFSVHKIFNELKSQGIKVGKNTLYEFLEMAQAVYLILVCEKFSYSEKMRAGGEKKAYFIDNGLLGALTLAISDNRGKLLENAVYLELLRRRETISFYKEKKECDFIIGNEKEDLQAIQVCHDLSLPETKERELAGLAEACSSLRLKTGTIITFEQEDEFKFKNISINVVPAYKFFLKW